MAGFLDNLLGGLVNDPTQPGGGWMAQLAGTSPTASTSTPILSTPMPESPLVDQGSSSQPIASSSPSTAPASGPLDLMSYFRPRTGLLGNSMLGSMVSGALSGLGSSTGYRGLAALGQGFGGATQAAQQRAQSQMQSILGGQQYQHGQLALQQGQLGLQQGQLGLQQSRLGLAESYGNLALAAARLRDLTGDQSITTDVLLNHPELMSQLGGGGTQSQTGTPAAGTASTAPLTSGTIAQPGVGGSTAAGGQSTSPVVTTSLPNMSAPPVGQGTSSTLPVLTPGAPPIGQGTSSTQPVFQGGLGASAAPPAARAPAATAPAATAPVTATAQAPDDSTTHGLAQPHAGDDPALAGLRRALQTAMIYSPDKIPTMEQQIVEYQNAAQHAANIAVATKNAEFGTQAAFAENMGKLKGAYNGETSVKDMQQAKPLYDEAMAADRAHRHAQDPNEQLASDMDLANAAIKMMNLNASSLRPQTAEAIQEAKGYQSLFAKAWQMVAGGTGLSPEVRTTMMNVIKQHYATYQSAYNTTAGNYAKQAQLYAPAGAPTIDPGLYRGDYAPQPTYPTPNATQIAVLKSNPAKWADFETKFGPGSSDPYLPAGG